MTLSRPLLFVLSALCVANVASTAIDWHLKCSTSHDCKKCGAWCDKEKGGVCRDGAECVNRCLGSGRSARCVQCFGAHHCSGDTPFCHEYECVACLSSADCNKNGVCGSTCSVRKACDHAAAIACDADTPNCLMRSDEAPQCVECTTDLHCFSIGSDTRRCDPSTNKCVACFEDEQCRSNGACDKVCDPEARACRAKVEGVAAVDCTATAATKVCEKVAGECVQCLQFRDCSGVAGKPWCRTEGGSHTCQECHEDWVCRSNTDCSPDHVCAKNATAPADVYMCDTSGGPGPNCLAQNQECNRSRARCENKSSVAAASSPLHILFLAACSALLGHSLFF